MTNNWYRGWGSLLLIGMGFLWGCVPARKLKDAQATSDSYRYRALKAEGTISDLKAQADSMQQSLLALQAHIQHLVQDSSDMSMHYKESQELNKNLNELYDRAVEQNKALLTTATSQKDQLNQQLATEQQQLQQREQRVQELESILHRKDSAVEALKNSIGKALLGLDTTDLSITNKDGKVYVSMAEKLLFPSGSTVVNPAGVDALKKLADVLRKNQDIHITVEGHTDNVPLSGTGSMKDNWDLSVLRATSIVRILTADGVSPEQVIASGRGQYMPVASNDSPEGRALNRRTDIILSPRLDELYNLLNAADTTQQ